MAFLKDLVLKVQSMRKCKGKAEGKKRATEFWGCTRYKDGCRGFLSLTDAKKQKR